MFLYLRAKFFYNNFGIRVMIIYFYFVLIDLIYDYKNIYYHNNNVFLGVCNYTF